MLIIVSLIIIILALIVLFFILAKKLPALAVLDVSNISQEKENQSKQKIIEARVNRDLARWSGWLGRFYLLISKHWAVFLEKRRSYLEKIKNNYLSRVKLPWAEKQKKVKALSITAQDCLKQEDLVEAEKCLVKIISLDQKNLPAFLDLADLYTSQKKWLEAREIYEYALKLAKQPDRVVLAGDILPQEVYFSLADMEKQAENYEAALDNIREALEFEPNSPRYLDLILDLSIIMKDKELAQQYWDKLAAVNPENQKLIEWQESIEKL